MTTKTGIKAVIWILIFIFILHGGGTRCHFLKCGLKDFHFDCLQNISDQLLTCQNVGEVTETKRKYEV